MRTYRIHGLRKAACTALAHAGCTGPQIMAISGHSSLAQVQIYIQEAEQGRMADAAIEKLEGREREQPLSTPASESVKPLQKRP